MTRHNIRGAVVMVAALFGGLSACDDNLVVTNPNAGETSRVLGTPLDAEALLASYFKRWHLGVYGSITDLEGMANVQSMMNYSSLANNCQNARTPFSGAGNGNAPGNTCQSEQVRLFQYMAEVDRVVNSVLDRFGEGMTLGTPARDNRAKAYAEFLRGISLGYVALMYDSAAVVTAKQGPEDFGVLIGYKGVADSAYASLQRSIDLANATVVGADGFPLPSTWIPSPTVFTSAEFVRLARSYRARIRANMARTPAERAAVDWAAVVADAQNGITADHQVITGTGNVSNGWRGQYFTYRNWHQMPPFFIGMADVSGSYAAWMAQSVSERGAGNNGFFMVTPDLRFPQGTTRTAQQADFAVAQCTVAATICKRYFVNRANGADEYSGASFGWSNYDHVRYQSWNSRGDAGTARTGKTDSFMKAEIDLLQAEGLYRQGNLSGAAALVNKTRVANGLPAITAFDATSPVPGGATNCVPKVPVAPYNVVACGNLFEALKYEKRIETAYTSFAPWFLDGRGWGDLPKDTPLFWAVPFQELQARGYALGDIYGVGLGAGNAPNGTAGPSVYGW